MGLGHRGTGEVLKLEDFLARKQAVEANRQAKKNQLLLAFEIMPWFSVFFNFVFTVSGALTGLLLEKKILCLLSSVTERRVIEMELCQ